MQSFIHAEYLSVALAKVWARKAFLPSTSALWRLYWKRVEAYGGFGKDFQFLGTERTNGELVMSADLRDERGLA